MSVDQNREAFIPYRLCQSSCPRVRYLCQSSYPGGRGTVDLISKNALYNYGMMGIVAEVLNLD